MLVALYFAFTLAWHDFQCVLLTMVIGNGGDDDDKFEKILNHGADDDYRYHCDGNDYNEDNDD